MTLRYVTLRYAMPSILSCSTTWADLHRRVQARIPCVFRKRIFFLVERKACVRSLGVSLRRADVLLNAIETMTRGHAIV